MPVACRLVIGAVRVAELPPGASEAEPLAWFLLNKFYLFKLRQDVKSCGRTGVVMMVNIYSK